MKPPDHALASGDRQMARALMLALAQNGHEIKLASRLQTFSATPQAATLSAFEDKADAERQLILTEWNRSRWRPDLWFSYHNYFKAPDLIGPSIARFLGIPYFLAEASHAAKRSSDTWKNWQAKAEDGIRLASRHFCFSRPDYLGLERFLDNPSQLVPLPPFIDVSPYPQLPPPRTMREPIELITVAMMRGGVKLDSYRFLAKALAQLVDVQWRLTIVGDGPQRSQVEMALSSLPVQRLRFLGTLDAPDVPRALIESDLYVWPGFGEAYGVAYLEAQACGLPVVALNCGGIESVVSNGQTGLLVDEEDNAAFNAAMRRLCTDHAFRHRLGLAAHRFVHEERSLDKAAAQLNFHLRQGVEVHWRERLELPGK
jgi:glycosyltransferase involved in cell wall biosynthesis